MIKKKNGYKFEYRPGCDATQLDVNFDIYHIVDFDSNDIILDIGAHIGTFCIPLSKKVKKIIALEPCIETFQILQKNIALNKCDNIIPIVYGISNEKKISKLYYNPNGNWGNSITRNFNNDYENISTISLKSIINDTKLKFDFMKMNCEGAEFETIINSDNDTLRKIKKMLILYHEDFSNYTADNIIEKLIEAGFSIKHDRKEKFRGWIIAKL